MANHPIGFIGLGIMGKAMARNLLAKGRSLVVFNRSAPPVQELIKEGATAASSPAQVARRCQTIVLMLPDGPDVEEVVCGQAGIIHGGANCHLVIDMSSIGPATSRLISRRLQGVGARYIDAPVSGGQPAAVAGTLSIMCGGSEQDISDSRPLLLEMGSQVVRVGDVGDGQTMKLVNQVLVALHLQAMAEALALAKACGLQIDNVYQAVSNGLAGSNVLKAKTPLVIADHYEPGFRVSLHRKDLDNALFLAKNLGIDMQATLSVTKQFSRLEAEGYGHNDHSIIVKMLDRVHHIYEASSPNPFPS